MARDASADERKASLRSWLIVVALAVLFLCWGLFVFLTVGDKGPPPWHFGVVKDVPGESPYGTTFTEPSPQHVSE